LRLPNILRTVERTLKRLLSWTGLNQGREIQEGDAVKVIRKGSAMRVIFFYPGEEGTYVDHAEVTLFENGIVHIQSNQEETTTHLQNCEILWHFETETEERTNKVRLLKPKTESRSMDESPSKADSSVNPANPELVE